MRRAFGWLVLVVLSACSPSERGTVSGVVSRLTEAERAERAAAIRDTAAARGLTNGVLLAGIAMAETGMAHCYSEATWACPGPHSTSCDGPVIAGAADGPCEDQQGGLGMFQFDAGTYDDTLAREGDRILTIEGNVDAALDFVVSMVLRSSYVEGVETEVDAISWMNQVEVRVGGRYFDEWIQTVTHYYNGCAPATCSVYESRYAGYSGQLLDIYTELGAEFWGQVEAPTCDPVPPRGAIIDIGDPCLELGGSAQYWRHETAGYDDSLVWTNATESDAAANFAVWHLGVESSDEYLLEVYVDTEFAESTQTTYVIDSAEGSIPVSLNQTSANGWRELGWYPLVSGSEHSVYLGDNTGENPNLERAIVVDALRVSPRGSAGGGGAGPGDSDGGAAPGDSDGGTPSGGEPNEDRDSDPSRGSIEGEIGCSCSTPGEGHAPRWGVAFVALGAMLARRRRRRVRQDRRS